MDIIGVKVIVLFLLGLTKVGFGLLPLLLHKYLTKRNKLKCLDRFIGLVLCVGGGILLSTVFIHMIKEVRESLEAATQTGVLGSMDFEYPFAELLICMGFLLIFLVESIVHKFFGDHHHPPPASSRKASIQPQIKSANGGARGVDNQAYIMEDAVIYPDTSESNSACSWSTQTNGSLTRSNDVKLRAAPLSEEHPDTALRASRSPFITTKKSDKNVYNVSSATLTSYASFDSDIGAGLDSQVSSNLRVPATSTLRGNYVGSSNSLGSSSSNNSIAREKSFVASIRGFLIVLALSIHSLFEGMAIGLEETDQGVWKLFTAVIIHSVAIVFCIGTEMISSGMKKKTILIYMIVLGVNSPIGVLIGLIVTLHVESASPAHLLAVGVLQGLAAGTLLYITFFEVLSREKLTRYRMTGIIGVLAIALGFTVMAVMEGTGSHTHSHGGPATARQLGGSGLNHSVSGHNHIHVEEILGSKEDAFNFNPYQHEQHGHSHDHRHHEYHHHHDHEASDHFNVNKMRNNSENQTFDLSDHNHESHDHEHGSHNHTKDVQDHGHEHDDHRNETHAHDDHQTDGHNHDVHKHDDHTHENYEVDNNEHKELDYYLNDHDNHDHKHNDHGHDHEQIEHEHSDHEHNDHENEHDDHEHEHDDHEHEHNDHEHEHNDYEHEHDDHEHNHEHEHDDHEHKHDNHEHEHDDHNHEHKAHALEQFEHSENDHGHIIHEHEYDYYDQDLSETMNSVPVKKSGENVEDDILDVTDLLSGVTNNFNSSRQGDIEVFVDG